MLDGLCCCCCWCWWWRRERRNFNIKIWFDLLKGQKWEMVNPFPGTGYHNPPTGHPRRRPLLDTHSGHTFTRVNRKWWKLMATVKSHRERRRDRRMNDGRTLTLNDVTWPRMRRRSDHKHCPLNLNAMSDYNIYQIFLHILFLGKENKSIAKDFLVSKYLK